MSSPTTAPPTTSSVPPGATTSLAAPSPTPTGNTGGGPSSSLYLFTFLATLFLLLFVSSAIILRSIVLRRRFRRRLEEAILGGVIPHNPTGRASRRRAIGEKPKLWEARVTPAPDDRWGAIIPVSVVSTNSTSGKHTKPNIGAIADADVHVHVHVDPGDGAAAATAAAPHPLPTHSPPHPRPPLYRRLWPPHSPFSFSLSRRRGGATVSSSLSSPLGNALRPISEPALSDDSSHSTHDDRLQVTVLIAMPDPRRPHLDRMVSAGHTKGKERSLDLDYEDDLPGMALGMTELLYGDAITTPKSS